MEKTKLYKEILSKLKAGEVIKIAFIGDSITSGEWVHPNFRDIFENLLKIFSIISEGKKKCIFSPDIYSNDKKLNAGYKPYID